MEEVCSNEGLDTFPLVADARQGRHDQGRHQRHIVFPNGVCQCFKYHLRQLGARGDLHGRQGLAHRWTFNTTKHLSDADDSVDPALRREFLLGHGAF